MPFTANGERKPDRGKSLVQASPGRGIGRLVLILDGAVILLAAVLAFLAHGTLSRWIVFLKDPPAVGTYALLLFLSAPLWLGFVPVFDLDRVADRVWKRWELLLALVKLHAVGLIALSFILFLTQIRFNRSLVLLFLASTFLLMYAVRVVIQLRIRYQYRHGHTLRHVLLVGELDESMREFVAGARADEMPPRLVGRLAEEGEAAAGEGDAGASEEPKLLGRPDQLEDILHQEPVDQVVFFPPYHDPRRSGKALDVCETLGIPSFFAVEIDGGSRSVPRIVSLDGRPFVLFDVAPKPPESLAVKHAFDLVTASLLLIVLAPLLLLVALAVLLFMGSPVLFVQKRAGLNGREFGMLKFRTMRRDAESRKEDLLEANEMDGPVFKLTEDPRTTPLGRFLRRWSIDELPQLLNVVSGSMSLVGPRPLPVEEQQQMKGWQRRRLSMKPGITGLWQVSGRSDVDFERWMKLDLKYIDEWSLVGDLKILLRTAGAVLSGTGAR